MSGEESAAEDAPEVQVQEEVDPDYNVVKDDTPKETVGEKRRKRKARFALLFNSLISEYKSILIIHVDNVGSNQMAQVRMALRGQAIFLLGKNTLVRRLLRIAKEKEPKWANLIPHMRGNVGLVFTNSDLIEVRNAILTHKVPASAKTGAIAPVDVYVPPGPTGMDPGQTSFFQALNIATKIMRGCIEIISMVHLVPKGEKCSASHVALLTKLNIKPFFYGIRVLKVFEEGDVFSSDVLDFSDQLLIGKFCNACRKLAAITMDIGYPNLASLPHLFTNALKPLVAIALETDFLFEEAALYKDMIDNPDKYGGGGGGGGGGDGGDAAAADAGGEAAAEAAPAEEDEPSSEGGVGGCGGMFGDSDDGDGDY